MIRFFSLCFCVAASTLPLSATVITRSIDGAQFGNQLFIIATAVALAEENNCGIYFPAFDCLNDPRFGVSALKKNYEAIFYRLSDRFVRAQPTCQYVEPDHNYHPIPYQPNIELLGYFQSDKYFNKYRSLILDLFSAPPYIEEYLKSNFSWVIDHPNTVGIHVRTGYPDIKREYNPNFYNVWLPPDMEYFKKAIELFDPDSLFVVFSDHIGWCKKQFKEIARNIFFIEGQDYLVDFYLLSKCKNTIIMNSTFGWWASYLNQNPDKQVVARSPWGNYGNNPTRDLYCEGWILVPMTNIPPAPTFDD